MFQICVYCHVIIHWLTHNSPQLFPVSDFISRKNLEDKYKVSQTHHTASQSAEQNGEQNGAALNTGNSATLNSTTIDGFEMSRMTHRTRLDTIATDSSEEALNFTDSFCNENINGGTTSAILRPSSLNVIPELHKYGARKRSVTKIVSAF